MGVTVKDIPNKVMMDKLNSIVGNRMVTRVGWLESTHEPNGVQTGYVAAIQEYGYAQGGIPPRPFFRPTIEARSSVWQKIIEDGAKKMFATSLSLKDTMTRIGDQAAGDFRRAIAKVTAPPLSEATLKARKRRGNSSKKPLSDSRTMMQTLTYTVTDQ